MAGSCTLSCGADVCNIVVAGVVSEVLGVYSIVVFGLLFSALPPFFLDHVALLYSSHATHFSSPFSTTNATTPNIRAIISPTNKTVFRSSKKRTCPRSTTGPTSTLLPIPLPLTSWPIKLIMHDLQNFSLVGSPLFLLPAVVCASQPSPHVIHALLSPPAVASTRRHDVFGP